MNNYPRILIILSISLVCAFSCSSCDDDDPGVATDNEVNNWIYGTMEKVYLWNDKLPASPNFNQQPDKFFNSICYQYDKDTNPDGDRFSFISSNYEELTNELSGIYANEIGFEYALYYTDEAKHNIYGEILYVKPNTPAWSKGLKRGQIFLSLNGVQINKTNYLNLFSLSGSFQLTVANDRNLEQMQTYSLNTVSNYADNPNYLDSIYEIGSKKIGYFVYNFFSDDSNNDSQSFNIEMAKVFGNFYANNITDLIIDLRYNSGGTLTSACCMASMLVKNRSTTTDFAQMKFNKLQMDALTEQQKEDNLYWKFADKLSIKAGGTVALPGFSSTINKIVFLTGSRTASASEMVINSLLPHNDNITLIGDVTVGKNVGSQTFTDEKNLHKNKWAIQPITVKLTNSAGKADFTAGFVPETEYLNKDNASPKYALGNKEEALLKIALAYITTGSPLRSATVEDASAKPLDSSISRKARSNQTILPTF